MKKFLALTLALVMSLSLVACGDKKTDDTKTDAPDQTEQPAENEGAYKVAMITDYGDITDQSFNQTTYEACRVLCSPFHSPSAHTDNRTSHSSNPCYFPYFILISF